MIFLWSTRNAEHIAIHEVSPAEAEDVITNAKPPFPEPTGDDKHVVLGRTLNGRFLHVLFVYVYVEDVESDEYQRLELWQRYALDDRDEAVRVIHARDLTEMEKWRLRRRRRGHQ